MLHIILTILKIIGIVAGILFLLLMLALFVPIRYQVDAKKEEELTVSARISWLKPLLAFAIDYKKRKVLTKLKIVGITIFDSSKPRNKTPKQKRSKKNKKIKELKKVERSSADEKVIDENSTDKEIQQLNEQIQHKLQKDTKEESNMQFDATDNVEISQAHGMLKKLILLLERIKKFLVGIIQLPRKICDWICKVKEKVTNLWDGIHGFGGKGNKIKRFLLDEENKLAYGIMFSTIKEIIKHIRPRKLKINIRFGTGDPCSTGEALGAFSILFAFYGQNICIEPYFNEEIYEGELMAKGHVTLFHLLILCIKLILDKHFRYFLDQLKGLKEEL